MATRVPVRTRPRLFTARRQRTSSLQPASSDLKGDPKEMPLPADSVTELTSPYSRMTWTSHDQRMYSHMEQLEIMISHTYRAAPGLAVEHETGKTVAPGAPMYAVCKVPSRAEPTISPICTTITLTTVHPLSNRALHKISAPLPDRGPLLCLTGAFRKCAHTAGACAGAIQ